jgi:predicted ABC-type ATPase
LEKVLYIIAQQAGFRVSLLFFWLNSIDLAIDRVRIRVSEGGHYIENHVIKRRYLRGIKNLFEIYLPIVDEGLFLIIVLERQKWFFRKTKRQIQLF